MNDFETIATRIPGPRSLELAQRLIRHESQNVTYIAGDFPVFWDRAEGALVTDVDGNRYIDFTAAFGVAAVGHANERVARAVASQAASLPHGMGDVHPTAVRAQLVERLAAVVPIEKAKVFLCSTGSESVEFALKTAALASGDAGVLAFAGAYHGLSYGALEVCGIPKFRKPWSKQLRNETIFAPFPDMREPNALERALGGIERTLRKTHSIGAIIVEPIQGRAGYISPPAGFLRGLRGLCDAVDALLIVDEIYTGFGRTGAMFACESEQIEPDLLCVGKALGGGFPIAATIGRAEVMDAWPLSTGEALHTSTFLGNPMGCAAALTVLDEFEERHLLQRAQAIGGRISERFNALSFLPGVESRGRGAMWALEFKEPQRARAAVITALRSGLIVLQSGLRGEVVTVSPPLTISDPQLERGLSLLANAVRTA